MIRFGLNKPAWQPQDIDALGDALCKFNHWFSNDSIDLGHFTVDLFRIVLKQDARPVKQKPYRHSPVLAAKVRTEIDKLLLAGILPEATRTGLAPSWASRNQMGVYD